MQRGPIVSSIAEARRRGAAKTLRVFFRVVKPTERFSNRVDDYVRYRPSYPLAVVTTLEHEAGLDPATTRVIDLGCGTGMSAALFLERGYAVTGVEPNAEMRAAAEARLGASPRFSIVAGTAESVPLPDDCCEVIVAAQAFHWFEPRVSKAEMKRLLVDQGWVALLWNDRRTDSTAFLRDYEALLLRHGTDYAKVMHRNWTDDAIAAFFGPQGCERRVFEYHQDFDWTGLYGRALSSSYVPAAGHPRHDAFVEALELSFQKHASGGTVRFEYDTRLYFGHLS